MRRGGVLAAVLGLLLLASAPLAPAADPFTPGSVTGRGRALRVGGFTGGLEYAITLGTALARAQGTQGDAQAQAVDLGVFGLILSQPGECTGTSPIPPEQVPRPLRVSSRSGNRSDTNIYADGQLVRGGSETVSVTTAPSSTARSDFGTFALAPVLTMDGLTTTADATIAPAHGRRTSQGSSTVGTIDIAGVVRMEGVRWQATRVTGKDARSTATFSPGRVTLTGVPLDAETPAEIASAFGTINAVLLPLGLKLDAPAVIERQDGTVEITPLVLRFGGADDANPLLGALYEQLQPLRDQVYGAASELGCPADPTYVNAALTIFDIVAASFSGSGGLVFEIGGARTVHDTTVYENPLGQGPNVVLGRTPPRVGGRTAGGPAQAARPARTEVTEATAGRSRTHCETTHPSGSPECSRGAAALAGGISLLVAIALFGGDVALARRRPTRRPAA